jgi:hypothetical protein
MTQNRRRKAAARAYQDATGVSYTEALRAVAGGELPGQESAEVGGQPEAVDPAGDAGWEADAGGWSPDPESEATTVDEQHESRQAEAEIAGWEPGDDR